MPCRKGLECSNEAPIVHQRARLRAACARLKDGHARAYWVPCLWYFAPCNARLQCHTGLPPSRRPCPMQASASDPTERSFGRSLAALLGICLAFMLIALNTSVVGTAMPRIVAELRGFALYPWAASAYLLGNAVMVPIAGRLGDLHGRKPFVLVSVLLFALASLACGGAQTMLQLVLARGLQGFAGGILLGVAAACVPDLFADVAQRVRWQVLLSSSYGIALMVGPALGGWMAEHHSWRYLFYINLPLAAAAFALVWAYFPHVLHHAQTERRIDWFGAVWLLATLSALLLAGESTQAPGSWGGAIVLGWCLTGALAWGFLRHQYRTAAPIVPPWMLDHAAARKLMALGALTGLTLFTLIFYTPLLLQGSFSLSPNEAGLTMTPLLVCITVGSVVNRRLMLRLRRAERLVACGQLGLALGFLLLTLLDAHTPRWQWMLVFALCGTSLGFQLPNLTLQMMAIAGRRHMGVASALAQSARMVGSMVGVSAASAVVDGIYRSTMAAALAHVAPVPAALSAVLASPQVLIRQQDRATLYPCARASNLDPALLLETARQGLISGTHAAYFLCAAISVLGILISLRLPPYAVRRGKRQPSDAPAAVGKNSQEES